jgi:hypothetical protein
LRISFSVGLVQPELMNHYHLDMSNRTANLTIISASADDGDIEHPGKYKCTIDFISKKFFVTIVKPNLSCRYYDRKKCFTMVLKNPSTFNPTLSNPLAGKF